MRHLNVFGMLAVVLAGSASAPDRAQAGPLLDWLTGKNRTQTAYLPPQGCETCTMTCQKVVVNYVPQTEYRTNWTQVPVTQYRPVTNSDPVTGCTITCMRPCTTYEWRAQRIPVTTYRPVYSTVTVQRPVTSMMPAMAPTTYAPAIPTGCSSCGTGGTMVGQPPVSGLLQPGAPYTMPAPAAGAQIPAAPTYPNTPSGPYSTVPGYAPAGASPGYPQGAVPAYPQGTVPGATYPQGTYPPGTYPQGAPTPADQPPRLEPGAIAYPPANTQRLAVPPTGSSIVVPGTSTPATAPPTQGYQAPASPTPAPSQTPPTTSSSAGYVPANSSNASPAAEGSSTFGNRSVTPPSIGASTGTTNPAPAAAPTQGASETSSSGSESPIRPVQDPAPDLRIPVDPARATGAANDQQTWSPAVRPWNYSPVRQAVYRGQEIEGTPAQYRQETVPAAVPSFGPAPDPKVNRPYGPATDMNPNPATAVDHGWRSLGR